MSSVQNHDVSNIETSSLDWVQRVVVGLDLCPFANHVVKSGQLLMHTELSDDMATVLKSMVAQIDRVLGDEVQANQLQANQLQAEQPLASADEQTVLFILPNGFKQFEDFLDLVDHAQALLEDLELDGVVQIATFHPQYQFSDSSFEDAANYTNRSPYPMLHLLQESSVEKAVEHYPDPENIPERNIEKLRSIDAEQLQELVHGEKSNGGGTQS